MSQNQSNLLLDALGAGKRPMTTPKKFYRNRTKSKSISPPRRNTFDDDDAPPTTMLDTVVPGDMGYDKNTGSHINFASSPSVYGSPAFGTSPQIRGSPLANRINVMAETPIKGQHVDFTDSPLASRGNYTPSSTRFDSPIPRDKTIGTSVTCVGFPLSQTNFVLDKMKSCGTIRHVQKGSNWMVIHFESSLSASKALGFNNTFFDNWMLCVNAGDTTIKTPIKSPLNLSYGLGLEEEEQVPRSDLSVKLPQSNLLQDDYQPVKFEVGQEIQTSIEPPTRIIGFYAHVYDFIFGCPRNLFVTKEKLNKALELVNKVKAGDVPSDLREYWKAKMICDSTLHPDTKEPIFLPFRMASFVPTNVPIIAFMLIPNPTMGMIVLGQWVNQSVNVAFNYMNANKTNPMSLYETGVAYFAAVASSCSIALGMNGLVKRVKSPGLQRVLSKTVPFTAVAAAGTLNVFLMRRKELVQGITVTDEYGETMGTSSIAGRYAITQVAISRIVTAAPALFIPGLVMSRLETSSLLKRMPKLALGVNLLTVTGSLLIALPCAIALFPQTATLQVEQIEDKFKSLKDSRGNPLQSVLFNRDRHVYGTSSQKDQCFDNLRVTRSAWDTNLVSANPSFIAVNLEAGGGGAFAILPHSAVGKLPDTLPVYNGHAGAVLDTDFNPFNDHVVASASEDCKAMIWTIPHEPLTESVSTPSVTLTGHGRKVGHVLFNPVADNILATTSADFTVKIWDISTGQEKIQLDGHGEIIQSISWSYEGNLLTSTCKDKKLRIFDVRQKKAIQETNGHQGVKGSRCTTMGNSALVCTSGFSRTSERQVFVWDSKNLSKPLKEEIIDISSGMLYLAGKGDGNIRYYEWSDDDKGLYFLSEYKSSDPLRGICFLPKRACAINENEVARAFKVHPTMVEPISFKVPRKADGFQSDLFPDTIGPNPAMTAEEWLNGKTSGPKLISLEDGFTPLPPREFTPSVVSGPSTVVSRNASSVQNSNLTFEGLKKENEELKLALAQKDARIRQLEAQMASLTQK